MARTKLEAAASTTANPDSPPFVLARLSALPRPLPHTRETHTYTHTHTATGPPNARPVPRILSGGIAASGSNRAPRESRFSRNEKTAPLRTRDDLLRTSWVSGARRTQSRRRAGFDGEDE